MWLVGMRWDGRGGRGGPTGAASSIYNNAIE